MDVNHLNLNLLGGINNVSGFSPDQIGGLAFWIDGSDSSTITSASPPVIDSVLDKSVNALLLDEAVGTEKPKTSTINGLGAIYFEDTDDYERVTEMPFVGSTGVGFTIIETPSTFPGANMNIVGSGDTNSSSYCVWASIYRAGVGTYYPRILQRQSITNAIRGDLLLSESTKYLFTMIINETSYGIRVNGVDQTLTVVNGSDNGDWFADTTGVDNTTIGNIYINSGQTAGFTGGLLGETIYYDDVTLTAGQIDQVEEYLADKWGVTLS